MDATAILAQLNEQAQSIDPIGATIKFVVDEHNVYIDGTGDSNVVSDSSADADCEISTSLETLMKLKSGDLNPMMAVMGGKIKIKGDMGLAMKLQSLLS